jgi:hypothetical protein
MNAAWPDWDAAFRALVQDDDEKPLVALLRSGEPMPTAACFALAELLDPQFPWSPFVKPNLPPPDQIQMVDGGPPRLKAAMEAEAAWDAVRVESDRLLSRETKKLGVQRRDLMGLEPFVEELAKEHDDEKALQTFARYKEAQDSLAEAKRAINPAIRVRLAVQPLSEEHRAHLLRNGRIVAEMLASEAKKRGANEAAKNAIKPAVVKMFAARAKGCSANEAAENIGEKVSLTGRQVKTIWGSARKAMAFLR